MNCAEARLDIGLKASNGLKHSESEARLSVALSILQQSKPHRDRYQLWWDRAMTFVSQSMWRRDRCDNRRMRSRAVSHLDGAELQRERYRYMSNWGKVTSVENHYR